jgi:hypothetical protein
VHEVLFCSSSLCREREREREGGREGGRERETEREEFKIEEKKQLMDEDLALLVKDNE